MLKVNDKVMINNTGTFCDGLYGTILGQAFDFAEMKMYIVMFDTALEDGTKATIYPESLLVKAYF